ncbi:MAG TPA: class I SAM-dependent methyltransferase [Anaeromyxobacteraceae bacterium]|nr:class I SAM-dependent methyltransferase [Anaeromyxobacteraceae bacterium]
MKLEALYGARFGARDEAFKAAVWAILWRRLFSRWIEPGDVLLDVGAGYCELTNVAVARRRIAVDLNPRTKECAAPGVEVRLASADRLDFLADGEVDVAFSSNFFEHLPDKATLSKVFSEIYRVLRPGGRLVAIGPNVRRMPGTYWDFYDHHLALSDRSLAEGLAMSGFAVEEMHAGYLPASTKSRLPQWPWLVSAYLALRPVVWPLLGRQFLVVARKPAAS